MGKPMGPGGGGAGAGLLKLLLGRAGGGGAPGGLPAAAGGIPSAGAIGGAAGGMPGGGMPGRPPMFGGMAGSMMPPQVSPGGPAGPSGMSPEPGGIRGLLQRRAQWQSEHPVATQALGAAGNVMSKWGTGGGGAGPPQEGMMIPRPEGPPGFLSPQPMQPPPDENGELEQRRRLIERLRMGQP